MFYRKRLKKVEDNPFLMADFDILHEFLAGRRKFKEERLKFIIEFLQLLCQKQKQLERKTRYSGKHRKQRKGE